MATEKRLIDANALKIHRMHNAGANHPLDVAYRKDIDNAPTVDAVEVCIQEVIRYIDLTFDRQCYDSIWLDEKGERHSADVGYGYEWWKECMKPELLRMFSNVGTKMDGDGNG